MCARGEMDIKGKGRMYTYWLEADAANARESIQDIDTGDRYRESIPVPETTEQWGSSWEAPADLLDTIESGKSVKRW